MLRRLAWPFVMIAASLVAVVASSCSLGEGQGNVTGTLDVADCWSGGFDLHPDFFAAVAYRQTLEIRIQNGGDYETFSDGVSILIDDYTKIRPALYGQPLAVSLPVGVTPPVLPIAPNTSPADVHFALYLQRTCRTQNVALYAVDSATLNADGTCTPPDGGGAPAITCPGSPVGLVDGGAPDASAASDAGAVGPSSAAGVVGHSAITFNALFDGDPNEENAAQRLNQGSFAVYLADPREICPGGVGPPPPCRGFLQGSFKFYFERGRPAQPFP